MSNFINDILNDVTFEGVIELVKFIIPIICTVWGIAYVRKPKFYYLERGNIKLYEDIVDSIDGLSITYKNQEIQENLRLFSGTIILKSHTDIKKEEIDKEVTIASPDTNARWKHFEITNTSTDFRPNFTLSENKVRIEKSLLKRNDFISFSGLLDSKNDTIIIGHRIYNIIPGTINLREQDLSLYKTYSIALPIVVIFMAFLHFSQSNTKPNHTSKSTTREFSHADSIAIKALEYDPIFFVSSIEFNIDSLEETEIQRQVQLIKEAVEDKASIMDSLHNVYENGKNDKNKINVLLSYIELLKVNANPYDNRYTSLKTAASDTLNDLLTQNNMDTSKIHQLNDSITLKYSTNHLARVENKGKKVGLISWPNIIDIFLSLVMYIFITLYTAFSLICIYKYFLLKRLIKAYKN